MYAHPYLYPNYQSNQEQETDYLKYVIIIIIILVGLVFAINMSEISEIYGVWKTGSSMRAYALTINKDVDKPYVIKVIGKFPYDDAPFLTYGTYPFLYKVSLYPIGSSIATHTIKFIPLPLKGGAYTLTLERSDGKSYVYTKKEDYKEQQEKVYTGENINM